MKPNRFVTRCSECNGFTSRAYAKKNEGKCKSCVTGEIESDTPTREQRILEHGYQAYAREEGHYDGGDQ